MCGIWACIRKDVQMTASIVDAFNTLKSRGPDSTTLHMEKNFIVGFHRLAINDLSADGNQPFHVVINDYEYTLVCNGEIYNYRELQNNMKIGLKSNSDCDVLLDLFFHFDEDFEKFNNAIDGEYSLIIIKKHINKNIIEFFFSTDPFSVRPLFWAYDESGLYVSSLLSGICNFSTDVKRLQGGEHISGSFNFNEDSKSLSGLQSNYINKNFITSKFYYNLPLLTRDYHDLNERIVNTLSEAVRIRLQSDRPIGCLLSGGLDSSLVAALAAKELSKNGERLRTFSIGMEGGTDLKYAKMVSKHINSIHTEYLFTPEIGLSVIDQVIKATETYDITTIRASVGQFLLAQAISKDTDIKVILNGDGADEVQMGYLYFYNSPSMNEAVEERNKLLTQIHQFDGLRVDRNISFHGLEARVPFLDRNFVNLLCRVNKGFLFPNKDKMEKYLIRNAFEKEIPGILPKEVLWRKKEAFSDGVSSKEKSWYLILKEHFKNIVGEYKTEDIEGIKPVCHESYYYRMKFNKLFNNNHKVIPRYWLPNWINTSEPSARTLTVYNDS